eukprot:TRINITY_DN15449_c0_g1_i1.p1 TRINITY_DN15449_c0_g1~~TRINITY_DN15449_c0_g1_i1.p1  ORF type:complete len:279 (+),score=47.59 TRINITY_DN15449_c0_g1_i1:266-1102(+)
MLARVVGILLVLTVVCGGTLYFFSQGRGEFQVALPVDGTRRVLSPQVVSWSPRVVLFHDFLSHEECDRLIEAGRSRLKRSQVVSASKEMRLNTARTSYGAWVGKNDDPVVQILQQRVAAASHQAPENGETIYLLHYDVGQQYRQHFDFFNPEKSWTNLRKGGQRMMTFLMYLNDVEEGGETIFPGINVKVPVRKGLGVLFHDLYPNGEYDINSLHGGDPVVKGEKWIATIWIREYPRYDKQSIVKQDAVDRKSRGLSRKRTGVKWVDPEWVVANEDDD